MADNTQAKNQEPVEAVDGEQEPVTQAQDSEPEAGTQQSTSAEEDEMAAKLATAQIEAKNNFDKWQRALADFDNYKKRVERERADAKENAIVEVVKTILPMIEDFERAIENVPEDLQGNPWVDGTAAIAKKLNRLLETYEIDVLDPVGEPFDPDMHQGLGIDEDSDLDSGLVTTTLQKGYIKGDKLLRPALVRVAG